MTETRKNPERWKRRLPILIVAGLVAAGLLISLFRDMGVVGTWRLRGKERQLQSELEELRQENARLKREVDDLRSNPAAIEEEARKLGLIKDREKVIVVPRRQDAPAQPSAKSGKGRP
ncbi:MAG TPA: septum formation initiator family protein [Candidatus Deferrimicrobiaceae bacterium]